MQVNVIWVLVGTDTSVTTGSVKSNSFSTVRAVSGLLKEVGPGLSCENMVGIGSGCFRMKDTVGIGSGCHRMKVAEFRVLWYAIIS